MKRGSEQQKATQRIGNLIFNKSPLSPRGMKKIEKIWLRIKETIHEQKILRYTDHSKMTNFIACYGTRDERYSWAILERLMTGEPQE